MAEHNRRFSPIVLTGDALLLLCALLGLTASFLSLYGDQTAVWSANTAVEWRITVLDYCAANAGQFLAWATLFALAGLSVWSLPRFQEAAAGGLAGLWALALWWNWTSVSTGAILVCKAIADQFSRLVDWGVTFEFETGQPFFQDVICARLFLLYALVPMALALGWAVVRARRWWLVLALTLPPLLPGLLADLFPSWPAFMALAACWCVMLLTDLCKWAAPDRRGKLTLVVFPAVAAVLAIITLAFPREGYTRPAWAVKAQEDLMNLTNRVADIFPSWDGPFQRTVTYVGAAEEADLSHAGPLNYSGRTVLRVTSDYDGRLYLRGSSLAVYEDGVWKALPDETYENVSDGSNGASFITQALFFPALLIEGGPTHTITVDNVGAVGSCVYAPYFPTPQDSDETGALPIRDAYFARRQGQWTNTLTFVDRTPPSHLNEEIGDMRPTSVDGITVAVAGTGTKYDRNLTLYTELVYGHYLDVPEELRAQLELEVQMAWSAGVLGESYMSAPIFPNYNAVKYAQQVGDFLSTFCEYDISAPAAPEGTDPVLYFLNESHRGYCMHYASAATLMLRTMGIPARYVSGFTAESVPDKQVDVPDRAAHAWVEVWVDGFGWYPVEVTPASAFEWYEQGSIPGDLPTETLPESDFPEATPTPEPTPTQEPDASPTPAGGLQGNDGEDRGGPAAPLVKALVVIPAVIALLCALVWLGQYLPKRRRAKKLSGPDPNRAALYAYGCLLRMERWGGRVDERAVELAQKAKFSQHTLTPEELDELRGLVDLERERLCIILGPAARLAFRYFWGMPHRSGLQENTEDSGENGA